MVEQVVTLYSGDERVIEPLIQDENLHYMHLVLPGPEALPEHWSNAPVYLTVLRGALSIGLEDQPIRDYPAGTLLKIPFHTKMNMQNRQERPLELLIVKAPAPQSN